MGKGHKAALAANLGRETKMKNMLKDPPPQTWSARMPAYCFTELCPVREMRMHPADREGKVGGEPNGQGDSEPVHRPEGRD